MQSLLEEFVLSQIVTLILVFARLGTIAMLMPGIGDSFVNARVRLLFSLAFSFVVANAVSKHMPEITSNVQFVWCIITEMIVGLFIGTICRIFVAALDVAGMLIGMNVGLGSAMMFNPQFAGQGSIIGIFLSLLGSVLIFSTNLHHMLIYGMIDSYNVFPVDGNIPLVEGMAQAVTMAVSQSFKIGFYLSVPFLVVSLFLYIAMGVLGRLMPQIQVFVLALPIQIALGLLALVMILPSLMFYWLNQYDEAIQLFFQQL